MEKSKSSKKDRLEKLRTSLGSDSGEKLHPDDEKYLKVLQNRLSKGSKESSVKVYSGSKKTDEKDYSLKPQVMIHHKEEKIEEPEFILPEVEKVEVKEESEIKDKELFEVKKVEVAGPEFIEVKPKETIKKAETSERKITQKIEEPGEKEYEKLPEWEPVETNIEQVEQKVKIEKKIEPKEENTESFVLEEKSEEAKDKEDEKLKKLEMKKAKKEAKEKERELKKKAKIEEKKKKLEAKIALKEEKSEPKEEELLEEKKEFTEIKEKDTTEEESEPEFEEIKEPSKEETSNQESLDTASREFEITEEEKKPEHDENILFEEKGEQLSDEEKQNKLDAFKDIKSIDEKTAILLYDNGFTSIDDLRLASVKDLSRLQGIKRKSAKKIKKELQEKEIARESIIDVTPREETSEHFILEEEFEEAKKEEEFLPEEEFIEEEKMFLEEDEEQTLPAKKDERIEVFKGMESIDEKTASLLVENGIISTDILKETSVRKLAKINGMNKKLAKKIKKEIKKKIKMDKKTAFSIAEAYDKDISKDFEEPSEQIAEETELRTKAKKSKKQKPKKKSKQYKHGSYTLYKKDVKTKSEGKEKRKVYFFSKQKRSKAEPSDLPKGFEVRINRKTGVPYLRKKK